MTAKSKRVIGYSILLSITGLFFTVLIWRMGLLKVAIIALTVAVLAPLISLGLALISAEDNKDE